MRKRDETTRADTCLARAHSEEMIFVLLGRDPAAPEAIRAWIGARIRLGKNKRDDAQILHALECAPRHGSGRQTMGSRRIIGTIEPAMPKRYTVKQQKYFAFGRRLYDVIDKQTQRAEFSSVLKSECLMRARKLNRQEAACAGGFNGRRK